MASCIHHAVTDATVAAHPAGRAERSRVLASSVSDSAGLHWTFSHTIVRWLLLRLRLQVRQPDSLDDGKCNLPHPPVPRDSLPPLANYLYWKNIDV